MQGASLGQCRHRLLLGRCLADARRRLLLKSTACSSAAPAVASNQQTSVSDAGGIDKQQLLAVAKEAAQAGAKVLSDTLPVRTKPLTISGIGSKKGPSKELMAIYDQCRGAVLKVLETRYPSHPVLDGGPAVQVMQTSIEPKDKHARNMLLSMRKAAAEALAAEQKARQQRLQAAAAEAEAGKAAEEGQAAAAGAKADGEDSTGDAAAVEGDEVGEKAGNDGARPEPPLGYLWCVDPVNGLENYAQPCPNFAVSVGVLQGADTVAGCIVEFAGGVGTWVTRTYTVTQGGGAFMGDMRLQVSATEKLRESLLSSNNETALRAANNLSVELFKSFTDTARGVRHLGSPAVQLCQVACGMVDGFWSYGDPPWSTCVSALVVQEAGGEVTTATGDRFSPFHRSIVASNTHMHGVLLANGIKTKTDHLVHKGGVYLGPTHIPDKYDAGWASQEAKVMAQARLKRAKLQMELDAIRAAERQAEEEEQRGPARNRAAQSGGRREGREAREGSGPREWSGGREGRGR